MSAFVLKMIAAASMLIDHAGLVLFPAQEFMRIIGRLAFPLYAFFIAEGFRYTKNFGKYFLKIAVLGVACQIVYAFVDSTLYLGVLISFSISLLIMYAVDSLKTALGGKNSRLSALITRITGKTVSNFADITLSAALSTILIGAALVLCFTVDVDYGFFGIMLPVMTSLFPDRTRRIAMFAVCLIALCIDLTFSHFTIQFWSLLTVPLLAVYNGKPGKYRLKYFFYIFYPAHIAILYGIALLL